MRTLKLAALAVCTLWPVAAVTQEAAPAPRARTRVETREGPFSVFAFTDNRGRIGVVVDTRANATNDKLGARIEGITPGGPAEKAGLKVGDIMTSFNGTALGGAAAEQDEDSGPGMKLIQLARRLDPGDTVQVEYRRGSDTRKATLVAEDLGWNGRVEMPEMRGMIDGMMPKMTVGPSEFEFAFGSPWAGIEMVKLNPDLGDYFGARDGVLVVKAPEDSSLALKGGDVIISIGGRKPASPEQAMRILRSYDPGETVTLDVLRKQRHVTLNWKVPENERHFFQMAPTRAHEEPSRFRIAPRPELRRIRSLMLGARTI